MDMIIKAKYVITDPQLGEKGILSDSAVYISGNKIVEIGSTEEITKKYPNVEIKGSDDQVLMPGFIDAHAHCAGISPFEGGVLPDFLENQFFDWAYSPELKPETRAKLSAVRHIRNGCTTINCNTGGDFEYLSIMLDAMIQSGIRFQLTLWGTDLNDVALDDTQFYKILPPHLQKYVKPQIFFDRKFRNERYFTLFDQLYEKYNKNRIRIALGPALATRCTDEFLIEVKRKADTLNKLPIHIHTLQTPIQKSFADKKFQKSQISHFEDIGFLDENITLGHAVYLTQEDIEMLADYKVSITHHANCNLIMRNGISPVHYLIKAGVNVALGMDDKAFNDDEDPITELRLIHRLHRIADFDLQNKPILDALKTLQIGTVNASRVTGFKGEIGAILPNKKADLILINLKELVSNPWVSPDINIAEILIHKAKGRDVDTVIIDGQVVMEKNRILTVDIEELYDEVRRQLSCGIDEKQKENALIQQELKGYCQKWYRSFDNIEFQPFYSMNSKI